MNKINIDDICKENLNYINKLKQDCKRNNLNFEEVYTYYISIIEENKKIFENGFNHDISTLSPIIYTLHKTAKNKVNKKYFNGIS